MTQWFKNLFTMLISRRVSELELENAALRAELHVTQGALKSAVKLALAQRRAASSDSEWG